MEKNKKKSCKIQPGKEFLSKGEVMPGKPYTPSVVDIHVGRRLQTRRTMLGLSQKDLAEKCGVTFQQIQKYECAGNRVSASRLFDLSQALNTPIDFFFMGLPGNLPSENKRNRSKPQISDQQPQDPLSKTESLELIRLYWKLPDNDKRELVMKMLRTLNTQ